MITIAGVKFAYVFPGRDVPLIASLVNGPAYLRLARAAEQAGFAGLCLDDHPAPTESWRQSPGGHDCLDPFVGLAACAAVTDRIALIPYLAVLPYRNPFLLAKAATTLDVMSNGRLVLGVGAGYMPGEFDALGADWDTRNEVVDETLEVLRLAWSGEPVTYESPRFTARDVTSQPTPVQRPHPPLWIGGNSRLTRRRVVEHAQGWMTMPLRRRPGQLHNTPFLETAGDLRRLAEYLHDYAAQTGRSTPIDIVHSARDAPTERAALVDWLAEHAAAGVTWVTVNGIGTDLAEAEAFIERYGAEIIAAFG